MLCSSVKKKGSIDRCTAKALPGYMLCGRHSKCKQVTFWVNPNQKHEKHIIRIQSAIRGWIVRKRLSLAGPGVLSRKNLANVEDIDTCTEYNREHPFTYFSFVENNQIYWFNFNSLWKWCLEKMEPTNPYTKVPITQETLKRLRSIWTYNYRYNRSLMPTESRLFSERLKGRWNIISQIFNANGFGVVAIDHCLHFSKRDYLVILRMLRNDMFLLNVSRDRTLCLRLINVCMRSTSCAAPQYILMCLNAIMTMLNCAKDQYSLAFMILSAIYRC